MDKLTARIRNEDDLTPGQLRYWRSLARETSADVVDPYRADLRVLRYEYPRGTRVYRASTGGRWGKSAVLVTL